MILVKVFVPEIIFQWFQFMFHKITSTIDSFINFDTTLRKKEIVVIAGDFNGQVGRNAEDYKDRHGSEE